MPIMKGKSELFSVLMKMELNGFCPGMRRSSCCTTIKLVSEQGKVQGEGPAQKIISGVVRRGV